MPHEFPHPLRRRNLFGSTNAPPAHQIDDPHPTSPLKLMTSCPITKNGMFGKQEGAGRGIDPIARRILFPKSRAHTKYPSKAPRLLLFRLFFSHPRVSSHPRRLQKGICRPPLVSSGGGTAGAVVVSFFSIECQHHVDRIIKVIYGGAATRKACTHTVSDRRL